MSAPRDMVGGRVKPVKCKHTDLSKAYANETLRVTGEGELRYCSWTGDPDDALTRHWIGAMRTDDVRALENPQWGRRTYASWDDHGELHPSDAWGPDLWVKIQVPQGLWRLSLYFVDWDWHGAPFPRKHRLAFLDGDGSESCTARVSAFGGGVYKVFGVQGGREVVFRVRKDFSATAVLSGIFLDHLDPVPVETLAEVRDASPPLRQQLGTLAALYKSKPLEFLRRLPDYRAVAEALAQTPPSKSPEAAAARQWLRFQVARRVPGDPIPQAEAFESYVQALAEPMREGAPAELERLGDEAFATGDLGLAERAYTAALRLYANGLGGTALATKYKARAAQFRTVHPLFAQAQCQRCLDAAKELTDDRESGYVAQAASELFALAGQDWKEGRGLVRVQYGLPELFYRRLVELSGYTRLSQRERENLMACVSRQTWYDVGWPELAAEQERLLDSLPPEEVTGTLLQSVLRTYAVLAQKDATYIGKAEAIAERMCGQLADGDKGNFPMEAAFKMMQLCYHERRWKKAKERCEELIRQWPDDPYCKEAKRLLEIVERELQKRR